MHAEITIDRDTVVVGGGLAGLVAASTAARAGGRVLVLDPHPPGGRARCDQRDGFVLNRGPRALYLGGTARPVLEDLGVDLSAGGPPPTRGVRVARGGRLHPAPDRAATLLRTSALAAREKVAFARVFASIPRVDARALAGTSVADWLDHLGLHDGPRLLAEAFLRLATYVDAPEQFDAGAAVANLQLALGAGVRYLDGGWQSIIDSLLARGDVEVWAHRADTISAEPATGTVCVATSAGLIRARSVVVATGTPAAAARLLDTEASSLGTLGPPVTAACLELGLRRAPDHPFVIGLDQPTYLSTHAPAADLAPPGHALAHVLRYHRPGEPIDTAADRDLLWRAAAQAGVSADDVVVERFLARMEVTGGLPTAAGGGLAGRPPAVHPERPGVALAGDWVGDQGLLADAAVASGRVAGLHAAGRSATMTVP